MGSQANKTEHSGSKKGSGSYWGRKTDAKKQSNRKRREQDKEIYQEKMRKFIEQTAGQYTFEGVL